MISCASITGYRDVIEDSNLRFAVVPGHEAGKDESSVHKLARMLSAYYGRADYSRCLRRKHNMAKLSTGGSRSLLKQYQSMEVDARYTVSGKPIESVLNRFTVPADVAYMDESAVTKVKEKHATDKPYMMVFVCPMAYSEKVADTIQKIRMEAGGLTPIALILPGEWMSFEIDARARGVNFFASRPVFSKTIYDFVNKAYLLRTKDGEEDDDDDVLPDCAGGRIMVVEDNDINAEIILEILGTTGVLTDRMTNGLEAVNKFKDVPENWYDLILMDVEMPVMDGYEATRAIRSCIRPDAKTIPIVAMTANAFSSDMEKAISAGMNDHLPKPIEIVKLGKILREYCLYRKEGE